MAIKIAGTEVINDNKRVLNNESLPDIRPSLLLDFANSKTLDPRITFTRGSTATYWDGKTTAKAEENLFKYSQDWTNGVWGSTGTTYTSNATTAPDGTTTADRMEITSAIAYAGLQQQIVGKGSTDYTASIYLKKANYDYLNLTMQSITSGNAYINNFATIRVDLSTGTQIGATTGTVSITDVGNGWYRLVISGTSASNTGKINVRSEFVDSSGNGFPTPLVSVGSQVYIWGAQIEERDSVTAYTATTTSPIVKYQPVLQTAASGEARFDHDPVTGESKGLLIEEARTNLAPYSETLDNSQWAKNNVTVTANASVAPDGTLTADLMQQGTSTDYMIAEDYLTLSADTVYTASAFVKYVGDVVEFGVFDSTAGHMGRIDFDASIPSISLNNGTDCGYEDVGNGWYRIWVSFTSGSTLTNSRIRYMLNSGQSGTGDGWSGVLAWGAQLEAGSFPTSYIPTSGSTVTRAKEEASFTYANSGFNQKETTIYAEVTMDHETANTYPRILDVPDSFIIAGVESGGYIYFQSTLTNYPTVNGDLNSFGIGTHKIAASFENHVGFSLSVDGDVNTASGEGFYIPSPEGQPFYLIGTTSNNRYLGGTVKKFAIYPKRLPNATLQAMTEA